MTAPHALPYPLIAAAAALLALFGLFRFFVRLRRDRLVADTPTARIRSAAQGYVKVTGRALPAGSAPTAAPLSSRPCVWWTATSRSAALPCYWGDCRIPQLRFACHPYARSVRSVMYVTDAVLVFGQYFGPASPCIALSFHG